MIPRTLFSAEHDTFRETARRFIAREITPHHAAWEKAGVVPRDLWLKAGAAGLLCCDVPDTYGGMGGDFLYSTIMIEEMARAGATGPTFYLQSDIIAPYLVEFGTEEQKQRWLPKMASGEVVAAVGMTEPSGGSDLQGMRTNAVRDGDEYVINGQKVFITNGNSADLLVLACKTDPKARAKGVSLLLVETDRPGYQRGRSLEKIGCKAQDTSELFFADLRVPVANLLGEEGRGFYHLMTQLSQERLVQAIRAVASSEAALEWTLDYAVQRKMFGHTLADFQNTQFKLAEMRAEILAQRVFVDRCVELHLQKKLDAVDAAIAKMITTELQGKVMDQCLQLFGGWGYMWEFPIARAYADARMTRIGGGSIEVMKQIIGRDLLPKPEKRARSGDLAPSAT
jgi:acyl-CoA dehydrogenase